VIKRIVKGGKAPSGNPSPVPRDMSEMMPPNGHPARPKLIPPPFRNRGLTAADYEAIRAAKVRIPEKATPVEVTLAQRSLERMVEIMEGRVPFRKANAALKATVALREEICGPIQRTVNVQGGLSLEALVSAATAAATTEVNVTPILPGEDDPQDG
jgi:hypothetical protein